jgi:hypothetical protein
MIKTSLLIFIIIFFINSYALIFIMTISSLKITFCLGYYIVLIFLTTTTTIPTLPTTYQLLQRNNSNNITTNVPRVCS